MKELIIISKAHGTKCMLIDDEDYDMVSKFSWYLLKGRNGTYYAATNRHIPKTRKHKTILAHRLIINAAAGSIVDHKDHNGLNNQKNNIRIATHSQNQANKTAKKNKASKYLGVSLHRKNNKWRATIIVNSKQRSIGYFFNEIEAAKAYDHAAKEVHGEFANLNFK